MDEEYGSRAAKHQRDVRTPVDRKGKRVEGRPYVDTRMARGAPIPDFSTKSFFRVFSLCLCSALFGFSMVMNVLVQNGPTSGSILDIKLNLVLSLPIAGVVFLWELTNFALTYTKRLHPHYLLFEVAIEALLAIGAAICAIAAAFQASRHQMYNNSTAQGPKYQDVGLQIALAAILGCLMISCLAIKTACIVEWNRRKCGTWDRYGVSPVNEIIDY